jgi:hypothetical protein
MFVSLREFYRGWYDIQKETNANRQVVEVTCIDKRPENQIS